MKAPDENLYKRAAEVISVAHALVISAGAGMGVDSGLPDFRGNQGFWKAYPALAASGHSFTDIASPRTFRQDERLAWGFYGHRLNLYRTTLPHAGFEILRKWAASMPLGSFIFTSNVDGQFQKAGFSRDHIHECHGSIHQLQCIDGCMHDVWSADEFSPEVDEVQCRLTNETPRCPYCGSVARPNILMFGDFEWCHTRVRPQQHREKAWLDNVLDKRGKVVVIEIGAGTSIPSVRHFSEQVAQKLGATIVRINPREFDVPGKQHIGIPEGSLAALKAIDALISPSRPAPSDSTRTKVAPAPSDEETAAALEAIVERAFAKKAAMSDAQFAEHVRHYTELEITAEQARDGGALSSEWIEKNL